VVIHYLYVVWAVLGPSKTYPPLVVDPDAVLTPSITDQPFQSIPRRNPQVVEVRSTIQDLQLALGHDPDRTESRRASAFEGLLRGARSEGPDHLLVIVYRLPENGKCAQVGGVPTGIAHRAATESSRDE
jgi:hypothetical protein